MADPDLATLERFVGDVERFATEHWARRPVVVHTGEDFTDLISIERIEELLLQAGRLPTMRLVRDGTPLDPRRYTGTVRLGGRAVDDVADVDRIAAEVADGATVVLQGLQRTDLCVAELCRSLERAISHPVQANAYLSPASATGLAAHADDHDVLVVQVSGSKHWETEHLGAVVTAPGDVLYLPAGERHAASTQEATSLHLTIGIIRVTRGDALRRLLDGADGLTEPLPLGYGRPERAEALAGSLVDAVDAATKALAGWDVQAATDREQRRARTRRRPSGLGHLPAVLAASSLDADAVLRRRPDQAVSLAVQEDGAIVLELRDRRIRFPAAMHAALARILADDPVRVGDLPGLSPGSRLVLARRLIREGVVLVAV